MTPVAADIKERLFNIRELPTIPVLHNRILKLMDGGNYSLDDQKNIKDPLGMNGVRLESDTLIIEGTTPYIRNLAKCFEQADIEMDDFVLAPLAAAKAILSKRQKELGVILIDIGGGTTSVAVFEENDLLHTAILPIGGNNITNDIAIGLRTSIEVAERVKLEYGSALPGEVSKKEDVNLAEIDTNEEGLVSRHHVAEIIEARLEEIFSMVNKELKIIGRDKLLPAGIILTGGTAKISGSVDLAKNILALPAQTGFPLPMGGLVDKIDDPAFATVAGLILWGLENSTMNRGTGAGNRLANNISTGIGSSVKSLKDWLGKFLP